MRTKTNLHFHTDDDPRDRITYSTKEGIDRFAQNGFGVLALTCHEKFAWTEEYAAYAAERGVVLIPGIEKELGKTPDGRGHTLILNCDVNAEKIETFSDLAEYRRTHPEIFVVAAHPYHPGKTCHGENLTEYIHLFDAIEHSWFYSPSWNPNVRAENTAIQFQKPLIATSDTHFFDFMNTDYTELEIDTPTIENILASLRAGQHSNVTRPKQLFREMVLPLASYTIYKSVRQIAQKISPSRVDNTPTEEHI